ncbi:MAG: class A beta-lactamase [Myxococcota bacterium]
MENRRQFVISLGAAALSMGTVDHSKALNTLERASKGRLGVAAWNRQSDARLLHRADERFVMCSTFKWILGALVLQKVDQKLEELDRRVDLSATALVAYSPRTSKHLKTGMSVRELCQAAIQTSDNTAANVLLELVGGPKGFTAELRALGDSITRIDDYEPKLNANPPGAVRNTTTPNAMLSLLRRFLFDSLLEKATRQQLVDWMVGSQTGKGRLRAGIPAPWTVGNKTGTSRASQSNDVAFALHENSAILMVSFHHVPAPLSTASDARHAAVARYVMRELS